MDYKKTQHTTLRTVDTDSLEIANIINILTDKSVSINCLYDIFDISTDAQRVDFFDRLHDLSSLGYLHENIPNYAINPLRINDFYVDMVMESERLRKVILKLAKILIVPAEKDKDYIKTYTDISEYLIANAKISSNSLACLANNLAIYFEYIEEHDKLVFYLQKAIDIQQATDSRHHELSFFYNNLSVVYLRKQEYKNCLNYTLKSIDLAQEQNYINYHTLANSYNIASSAFNELKDYKKAVDYNMIAIDIAEQNIEDNGKILAKYYYDTAMSFFHMGVHDKAMFFINKAIDKYSISKKEEDDFMSRLNKRKDYFETTQQKYFYFLKVLKFAAIGFVASGLILALYYFFI